MDRLQKRLGIEWFPDAVAAGVGNKWKRKNDMICCEQIHVCPWMTFSSQEFSVSAAAGKHVEAASLFVYAKC